MGVRATSWMGVGVGVLAACSLDPTGILAVDGGARDATAQEVGAGNESSGADHSVTDGTMRSDGNVKDGGADGRDTGAVKDAPLELTVYPLDGGDGPNPQFHCPGKGNVLDCAMDCPSDPLGCLYCVSDSGLEGVCVKWGQDCAGRAPAGADMCPCGGSGDCLVPNQVCLEDGGCGTCGQAGSDRLDCQSGGDCNMADGGCN